MRKILIGIILLFASMAVIASGSSDMEAVEKASLHYIEGFYEGDPAKLKACLIPELNKHGYYKRKGTDKYVPAGDFPFTKALTYAENVRAKKDFAKPGSPKEVEVLGLSNKIAITKVTANWGIDYMLLAKNDGKWMIRQILWEGPDRTSNPTETDKKSAMQTGLNYIEAFYEGNEAKLRSALKPTMYKWGYSLDRKTGKYKKGKQMTFKMALGFLEGVRKGEWKPKPGAPKKVEVLDVMNHIAAIKVTAAWGIDYMLLSRDGDKWITEHVIWSSIPKKKA
ncbi:MAG: hypothetical protein HKN25_06540 [Pyrinomonadaceae bacterium]|nr:hypothetical protein [Pyrinomonadaceae bacterium]